MSKRNIMRVIGLACTAVLAIVVLAACATQNANRQDEQTVANQEYMAQVNRTMEDLADKLELFSDAVARGDVVTMRAQADNAFKVIDDLSDIEVPNDLQEIQDDYVDGCNDLEEALNAYVDLYTEIETATEIQPFDYSTYDERLEEIQDTYDTGIGKLQSGNNKATEKE